MFAISRWCVMKMNHNPISKVKISVFICMLSCPGCSYLMHKRILWGEGGIKRVGNMYIFWKILFFNLSSCHLFAFHHYQWQSFEIGSNCSQTSATKTVHNTTLTELFLLEIYFCEKWNHKLAYPIMLRQTFPFL